jgi:hypothetical protein
MVMDVSNDDHDNNIIAAGVGAASLLVLIYDDSMM